MKLPRKFLEQGEIVGIFPEGKMRRDEPLTYGRPGAAYLARITGVPVLPVALTGTHIFVRSIVAGKQKITVSFGEPFMLQDKNDMAGAATIMRAVKKLLANG